MGHAQKPPEGDTLCFRFTAWLKTLIYRARIDYLRQIKRRVEEVSIETLRGAKSMLIQYDECLATDTTKKIFEFEEERLARAFSKLSPTRQQILKMLFIEDLQPDEIAEQLNCTLQHVYNQRSLALKVLRELLE